MCNVRFSGKLSTTLQTRLRGKKPREKEKDSTNQNTDKPDIETGTVKHGD